MPGREHKPRRSLVPVVRFRYALPVSAPTDPLTYFTGLADRYAANRPSYPTEAIEAILNGLERAPAVADVGCGTGIATVLLARAGARVLAIEPNDEMRRRATEDLPRAFSAQVQFRNATAERTGLDDATVDAVLCAQSFHWFDLEPALSEFHRITKPGGRLALMWNVRVPVSAFDDIYAQCVVEAQEKAKLEGRVLRRNYGVDLNELGPRFRDGRTMKWSNPQVCDLATMLGKATSASYFPRDPAAAEVLLERLTKAFHEHQQDGVVSIHQECRLTLATRS